MFFLKKIRDYLASRNLHATVATKRFYHNRGTVKDPAGCLCTHTVFNMLALQTIWDSDHLEPSPMSPFLWSCRLATKSRLTARRGRKQGRRWNWSPNLRRMPQDGFHGEKDGLPLGVAYFQTNSYGTVMDIWYILDYFGGYLKNSWVFISHKDNWRIWNLVLDYTNLCIYSVWILDMDYGWSWMWIIE